MAGVYGLHEHDALTALVGDARVVLLGGADHGSDEFGREDARITKRLIAEHGFHGVVIVDDRPGSVRASRYVPGVSEDRDAEAALRGFRHFPAWMWGNADVLELVGWLHTHNDGLHPTARRAGLYGLGPSTAIAAGADEHDGRRFLDRGAITRHDLALADGLDRLMAHLDRHGGTARIVVWAHERQVVDAGAAGGPGRDRLSLGRLLHERHGEEVVDLGAAANAGVATRAAVV